MREEFWERRQRPQTGNSPSHFARFFRQARQAVPRWRGRSASTTFLTEGAGVVNDDDEGKGWGSSMVVDDGERTDLENDDDGEKN